MLLYIQGTANEGCTDINATALGLHTYICSCLNNHGDSVGRYVFTRITLTVN